MRQVIKSILAVTVLFLISCSKQSSEHVYKSGKCIDTHYVTSPAGSLSVLVDTKGVWRVDCDEPWVSIDVRGGIDRQAFTISWLSNESDILSLKPTRKADIVIRLDESMTADTLRLIQQGFVHKDYVMTSEEDPDLTLEYVRTTPTEVSILCCSSEGSTYDAVLEWAQTAADVVAIDGDVIGEVEGINIAGCDFKGLSVDEEYAEFSNLVSSTVNSSPETGLDWVICGQMYHYSMMQTGYDSTPSWYPATKEAKEFRSDLYAWQSNMYDVVWMSKQAYVVTYTDEEGYSFSADYVYVSSSLLAKIYDVELLDCPVAGMTHNPIRITLKY